MLQSVISEFMHEYQLPLSTAEIGTPESSASSSRQKNPGKAGACRIGALLLAVAFAFVTGCTTSEVQQIGENLYLVAASSAFNDSAKKIEIIQIANEFAAAKGKIAEKVSLKEEHPSVGMGGQFEYQFRMVDPNAKTAGNDTEILNRLRAEGKITEEEFRQLSK